MMLQPRPRSCEHVSPYTDHLPHAFMSQYRWSRFLPHARESVEVRAANRRIVHLNEDLALLQCLRERHILELKRLVRAREERYAGC